MGVDIPSICIIGNTTQAGTYILRIRLTADTALQFGGFKKGQLIPLRRGDYLYVGSALAEKGPSSLARRLIRHGTRSGHRPPHRIRKKMTDAFTRHGLGRRDLLPKRQKTLHWNVDYLLDLPSAEIVNIFAIRATERLEHRFAAELESSPHTHIIERGLGANDTKGATHLLYFSGDDADWLSTVSALSREPC